MVTKVLTNYARVLMFLEDLVSLPEDCGQNSDEEITVLLHRSACPGRTDGPAPRINPLIVKVVKSS